MPNGVEYGEGTLFCCDFSSCAPIFEDEAPDWMQEDRGDVLDVEPYVEGIDPFDPQECGTEEEQFSKPIIRELKQNKIQLIN